MTVIHVLVLHFTLHVVFICKLYFSIKCYVFFIFQALGEVVPDLGHVQEDIEVVQGQGDVVVLVLGIGGQGHDIALDPKGDQGHASALDLVLERNDQAQGKY